MSSVTVRRAERWTKAEGWKIPTVGERDRRALAGHTHSAETARRCRIVLLALEGWSDTAIADRLDLPVQAVTWWKDQFAKDGIAGLIDRPTTSGPPTGSPRRVGREVVVGGSPSPNEVAGPQFDAARKLTDQSSTAAARAAQRGRAHGGMLSGGGRAFVVRPRLVADVELIAAFGSPQVQVAGLLEVQEPTICVGRRGRQVASSEGDAATRAVDGVGPITWLSRSQPAADQLADFIRQARKSAPGRRLHLVTANPRVFAWLRSLRSRDISTNLAAHLAVGSQAWPNLMQDWASMQQDPTDGDTIRRLSASGQRFSWFKPTHQAAGPPTDEPDTGNEQPRDDQDEDRAGSSRP